MSILEVSLELGINKTAIYGHIKRSDKSAFGREFKKDRKGEWKIGRRVFNRFKKNKIKTGRINKGM